MSNFIRRLEIRNRTERHGPQGSEVVVEYHVDPYKARPLVISSLLGYTILGDTAEGSTWSVLDVTGG